MTRVLLTAFEPYDNWSENSSWLALVELARELPAEPAITTRRYPVNYLRLRECLDKDLEGRFDYVLHMGQAPGIGSVHLEAFGINVRHSDDRDLDRYEPLESTGHAAYRSAAPLAEWAARIRAAGIPARISHHAGTYLCNAALYWSHFLCGQLGYGSKIAFIHLPLDSSQAVGMAKDTPCLPASIAARAIRILLEGLQ
jgi:pyroglutamyl-peptidase